MGQQVAAEVDGAAVGEAEQPFDQDQRRFERDSVVTVVVCGQGAGVALRVGDRRLADAALAVLIPRYAVVVEDGGANCRERDERDERVAPRQPPRRILRQLRQ